jgi:hypothetical protein
MRSLDLDDAEREAVDEENNIDADSRPAGLAHGELARHLEGVCSPVGPVDELEWPFARRCADGLRQRNAQHQVIRHSLIRAHNTFGDAIREPSDGGVDIGLRERVSSTVKQYSVDPREIGP